MNHPLLHQYSDYDTGKTHLESLDFEVERFNSTSKNGLQFAWVKVSDKLMKQDDRQYFHKGTRVIANLETDGKLIGYSSSKIDDHYIEIIRKNLQGNKN